MLGVIVRPFGWPEAVWAVAGACLLVAARLMSAADAWAGIRNGLDVYLFLLGMMLLAEVARGEGLFDWLAGHAVRLARGSAPRLFLLIYAVGTLVTVFLSNDATAVVLTPAVYAAAKAARAKALPYLLICALVANAASFVLPISNPANLVVYAGHMPPLGRWLAMFASASAASIVITYVALRWSQRAALRTAIALDAPSPTLSRYGAMAAGGLLATVLVLLATSALDAQLGLPTFIAGSATAAVVLSAKRASPRLVLAGISWSVLPLVAGLFVLVEALQANGTVGKLAAFLRLEAERSASSAAWAAGLIVAVATNLVNNLPAGLLAGSIVRSAPVPDVVSGAILIGVDLGPNLSVTGSLATILWLTALRREGEHVSAWTFLKVGLVVTPPALVAALGAQLFFR